MLYLVVGARVCVRLREKESREVDFCLQCAYYVTIIFGHRRAAEACPDLYMSPAAERWVYYHILVKRLAPT